MSIMWSRLLHMFRGWYYWLQVLCTRIRHGDKRFNWYLFCNTGMSLKLCYVLKCRLREPMCDVQPRLRLWWWYWIRSRWWYLSDMPFQLSYVHFCSRLMRIMQSKLLIECLDTFLLIVWIEWIWKWHHLQLMWLRMCNMLSRWTR